MRQRTLLAFAIVYLVWGSTYLAIRYAVETMPPFFLAGTRFLLAGGTLMVWARLRGAPAPDRREWKASLQLGVLYIVFGNGLVVWAERWVESGAAALVVASVPIWVALIDHFRSGRMFGPGRWLGLASGLAGIVVLVGPGSARGLDPLGATLLLVASVTWSLGSVIQRELPLPKDRILSAGTQMLCAGIVMVVLSTALGDWREVLASPPSARSWLAWSYLVVAGSMIAFTAYSWLAAHEEPTRVATYAYVNPVIAVLLGWGLAGEALTLRMIIAMAAIVGAVVLIVWPVPAGTGRIEARAGREPAPTPRVSSTSPV